MLGYHTVHLIASYCIETIELELFETPTPIHILTKYEHFLINRQRQHLHCVFFFFHLNKNIELIDKVFGMNLYSKSTSYI